MEMSHSGRRPMRSTNWATTVATTTDKFSNSRGLLLTVEKSQTAVNSADLDRLYNANKLENWREVAEVSAVRHCVLCTH